MTRNFGGIANSKLYVKSSTGTKQLVEDFIDEIVMQLRQLGQNIENITSHVLLRQKLDLFKTLRHSLGNTALLLSGGGSIGVYHIGVLEGILESGMLPRIIAGSSSGSIIAAMICTRTEDEYPDLIQLKNVNYHFIEPPNGDRSFVHDILRKFRRWIRNGLIFDPNHIKSVLIENLGDLTFLEAFQKTERVLNITVSSSTSYEMPCLLNYITAPDVLVWSAVLASCALPGFFPSVQLLAKMHTGEYKPWHSADSRWIDGSVENDIPMKRLSELFNVNHFIVCQVNPHIYPFIALSPKHSLLGSIYEKIFLLVMSEMKYRLQQLHSIGLFRKLTYYLLNIIQQPYQGDITIVPKLALKDYMYMFSDLDRKSVENALIRGRHAVWPKISTMKMHGLVEQTLDEILFKLRSRLYEVAGPRQSTESLLDAFHESSNLLALSKTSEQMSTIEDIEDMILDTASVISYPDSIIFQSEEDKPAEFSKPRLRSQSLAFSSIPPDTI